MASESVNALIGTIRPGNYDAQTLPQIGSPDTFPTSRYLPQSGPDPSVIGAHASATALVTALNVNGNCYPWYHTALSGERFVVDQFGANGIWGSNYQFNVSYMLLFCN